MRYRLVSTQYGSLARRGPHQPMVRPSRSNQLSLALSHRDSGDLEAAIRCGQRSLALFEAAEAGREAAILINTLAIAYLRLGSLEQAELHVHQARMRAEALRGRSLVRAHRGHGGAGCASFSSQSGC
jgi:tetratricopeptide (TPR) repeat protein